MSASSKRVRVSAKFSRYLRAYKVTLLAEILGVPRQYIYFWRNGDCRPSLTHAARIMDHAATEGLSLDLKDLVGSGGGR